MHTTNYFGTLITPSADCPVSESTAPGKPDSVAGLQYALLADAPYALSSDDVLFEVFARRKDIPEAEREEARAAFFAKPQACLRASPLVKSFGWGLHHDADGRVALVDRNSDIYAALLADEGVIKRPGMRSRRE